MEEIDRQFKGDIAKPGSDRSKRFIQRMSTMLFVSHSSKVSTDVSHVVAQLCRVRLATQILWV